MSDVDTLKRLLAEWQECLEGTRLPEVDPNSVMGVIETLFWEMAAYESYLAICGDTRAVHWPPYFLVISQLLINVRTTLANDPMPKSCPCI